MQIHYINIDFENAQYSYGIQLIYLDSHILLMIDVFIDIITVVITGKGNSVYCQRNCWKKLNSDLRFSNRIYLNLASK